MIFERSRYSDDTGTRCLLLPRLLPSAVVCKLGIWLTRNKLRLKGVCKNFHPLKVTVIVASERTNSTAQRVPSALPVAHAAMVLQQRVAYSMLTNLCSDFTRISQNYLRQVFNCDNSVFSFKLNRTRKEFIGNLNRTANGLSIPNQLFNNKSTS